MDRSRAIISRLAAFVLTLALCLAPAVSALTHGPGQAAIAADHAAWHAEQGQHGHEHDHGHHGSADHDHSPTVILPASGDLDPPPPAAIHAAHRNDPSGIIRDGPRRPPRLT